MRSPAKDVQDAAFLGEIPVEVVVELGRLKMVLRDLAALSEEDVIELDQPLESPLDLVVGGKRLARGELIEVGGRVALRIIEVTGKENS